MKIAVIYYSYEGHCAQVAKILQDILRADLFEIKTVDGKKRTGLAKYFWGGGQVMRKIKPPIKPLPVDTGKYDLIILGTPVWAGSPAPAMVSFLAGKNITGKKVALFCCNDGGKGKVFQKLKALVSGNTIAGEIEFVRLAKTDPSLLKKKVAEWVKTIGA
ncbi:MAG: flavodoxin [Treponema sp.]|nr:flavodoxin [Treponema sp.]